MKTVIVNEKDLKKLLNDKYVFLRGFGDKTNFTQYSLTLEIGEPNKYYLETEHYNEVVDEYSNRHFLRRFTEVEEVTVKVRDKQ